MKLDVVSFEDLERKNAAKRDLKREVLIKILNMSSKRIELYYSLGRTDILIEIPEMIFGYPPYNLSFVTVYINKQFQNLGYSTSIMGPGLIHVSWYIPKVKNIEIGKKKKVIVEEPSDLHSLANLKKTADMLRKKYISK
jgi:Family of unknown function (DUF5759)